MSEENQMYSKEKFEHAKKREKDVLEIDSYARMGLVDPKSYGTIFKEKAEVKDLLEKLLESGHSEAVKLNEDYNQLLKNLTNAQEAIETFKKEKLGMSGEKDIIE